jgi:hypothetical protein
MPYFYILDERQANPERSNQPEHEESHWEQLQPAPFFWHRAQQLHPKLEEECEGYSQHEMLDCIQEIKYRRSQELSLDGDEQITPFVETMQETKASQPEQAARQVQARIAPGLHDNRQPKNEEDLSIDKENKRAVDAEPFS